MLVVLVKNLCVFQDYKQRSTSTLCGFFVNFLCFVSDLTYPKLNRSLETPSLSLSLSTLQIHSVRGINRASSLVVAYLMAQYGWSMDSAADFVITAHPDSKIEPHFMKQLTNLQADFTLHGDRDMYVIWVLFTIETAYERCCEPLFDY